MLFETKRLKIQEISMEHLEELLLIYNNTHTMKYIPNSPLVWSKDAIQQKFSSNSDNYLLGLGVYAVIDKTSGRFIGQAGIYNSFNTTERLEIGYILTLEFWNKGYGTEICSGLIKYCFERLKTQSVIARMYALNTGSRRVSEKSGMSFLEEHLLDNQCYRATYIIENPS